MRKGRCPPGQRLLLPLFEMHAVFFVAAFTRFFILLCGIAECKNGMRHDGLRQVKQCGLLFYAIHLRPCAEPHRAEAECIGAKQRKIAAGVTEKPAMTFSREREACSGSSVTTSPW